VIDTGLLCTTTLAVKRANSLAYQWSAVNDAQHCDVYWIRIPQCVCGSNRLLFSHVPSRAPFPEFYVILTNANITTRSLYTVLILQVDRQTHKSNVLFW